MIYTGTISPLPVPYQRMTHKGRHTPRAKRYHASQARCALLMRAAMKRPIRGPYRLSVVVHVSPTKAGGFPGNRGDLDNHGKAVADALQFGNLVPGDDMRWMRAVSAEVALTDGPERLDWTLTELDPGADPYACPNCNAEWTSDPRCGPAVLTQVTT